MIDIDIPGRETLRLEHLLLDYNGTLACDGRLLEGVATRLFALADRLRIQVLTADTFGLVRQQLDGMPWEITLIPPGDEASAKAQRVRDLGPESVAAVGNGRNDLLMLDEAALGIAVIQEEGASVKAVLAADLVCASILDALDLFEHPERIVAGLRS